MLWICSSFEDGCFRTSPRASLSAHGTKIDEKDAGSFQDGDARMQFRQGTPDNLPSKKPIEFRQRVESSLATLAFAYYVKSEGGNMDDPGPEHFGDETDLAKVTRVKEAAAVAFHKANQDLAVRAAALHRARVETEELAVGDYYV